MEKIKNVILPRLGKKPLIFQSYKFIEMLSTAIKKWLYLVWKLVTFSDALVVKSSPLTLEGKKQFWLCLFFILSLQGHFKNSLYQLKKEAGYTLCLKLYFILTYCWQLLSIKSTRVFSLLWYRWQSNQNHWTKCNKNFTFLSHF